MSTTPDEDRKDGESGDRNRGDKEKDGEDKDDTDSEWDREPPQPRSINARRKTRKEKE